MGEPLKEIQKTNLANLDSTAEKELPEIVRTMTIFEARECVKKINQNIQSTRALLLELYERKGWEALGYGSWRECVVKEFGGKQAYAYFQLSAAKVERNLSTIVEKTESILESHLRPLASLQPEEQKEAYGKAIRAAADGKVTARLVEKAVQELKHIEEVDPISDAMAFADMAINQIERIRQDDPKRQEAIQKVTSWCNVKLQGVEASRRTQ